MQKYTIDFFLPCMAADVPEIAKELAREANVKNVCLVTPSQMNIAGADKISQLVAEDLGSTTYFRNIAQLATADYVVLLSKENVAVDYDKLCMLFEKMPNEASMAYSHYRKVVNGAVADAPTIDYQAGSLRNDFDFGSLRVFKVSALKQYLEMSLDEYQYAGLYQLRLALSRVGEIFHFEDFVYTEQELDNRKSGEKQFDYVNPAQRNVQIEMEKACTYHLRAVGAWLPPCEYDDIDLSCGDFPVEASVIIPVLNREMTIADAVSSVLEQKTSFPFNVIVVDNHSTDKTGEIIDSFNDGRVVHLVPGRNDLGIGGCWSLAVKSEYCGRFAVQLDSDDIYSGPDTLQRIVDEFYKQRCAMLVGTYRICDFDLNTLPPGIIDHREWTEDNGRNNALRINGLGAPRAFYTPVIREVDFPNVSYGEDYAVGLKISRKYRIGRVYDVLYLCRRWGGNSDAVLSHEKVNAHNFYKDSLRTVEFDARRELMKGKTIPSLEKLSHFFTKQLSAWPMAAKNYEQLNGVEERSLEHGMKLQYNPARMVSTAANVDEKVIAERKCFLCEQNRPTEQLVENAMGIFDVLVNPFPILLYHFTLPVKEHKPQLVKNMYVGMLHVAHEWNDMAVFYNGAKCGASAPDHAHLQAVKQNAIPLFDESWNDKLSFEPVLASCDGEIYDVKGYVVPLFAVSSSTVSTSVKLFDALLSAMPVVNGELEPRMNVIAYYVPGEGYMTMVFPRAKHRPVCYYADGEEQRLVSPGTLDMAGLVITPCEKDFCSITSNDAVNILREVALSFDDAEKVVEKLNGLGDEN